ncbi:MAG: hypothetical protein ACR2K6_03335, partial [Solirubrobacterales bacterium]
MNKRSRRAGSFAADPPRPVGEAGSSRGGAAQQLIQEDAFPQAAFADLKGLAEELRELLQDQDSRRQHLDPAGIEL